MNFFERNPMVIVGIVMLIIWVSLGVYFVMYAEEISKDPCSVCAKKVGDDYTCIPKGLGQQVTYNLNGTIDVDNSQIINEFNKRTNISSLFNGTKLEGLFKNEDQDNLSYNMTNLIANT